MNFMKEIITSSGKAVIAWKIEGKNEMTKFEFECTIKGIVTHTHMGDKITKEIRDYSACVYQSTPISQNLPKLFTIGWAEIRWIARSWS